MTILSRYRTVFSGVAGTPWYSNIFFDENVTSSPLYGEFVADFWTALNAVMCTPVTWSVIPEVAFIDDATGQIIDLSTWAGEGGSAANTNEDMPYANQALINWRTGTYLAGRELRGKTFVPALTQAANDNGQLIAGTRASIDAAAEELISDGNGAMRVFSPTHLTSSPITSSDVPAKIAILRSRRD
jgi:hypothetical protein